MSFVKDLIHLSSHRNSHGASFYIPLHCFIRWLVIRWSRAGREWDASYHLFVHRPITMTCVNFVRAIILCPCHPVPWYFIIDISVLLGSSWAAQKESIAFRSLNFTFQTHLNGFRNADSKKENHTNSWQKKILASWSRFQTSIFRTPQLKIVVSCMIDEQE